MGDILSGEPLDGKYRIEQLLGEGGMGAVYRAIHLGTTRTVAVKIIHPRFSRDQEFVERLRREAEAAGRLRHPNVLDVTDFGFAATPNGQVAYLVMEYLDGRSLADVLEQEKRLSTGSAVDILEQACSAVEESTPPRDRPSRSEARQSAAGFGSATRASAEGSGALLRDAVSLYSEHFPAFFRLSLLANAPLIASATIVAIIDVVTPDGSSTPLTAVLIFLAMAASNLFAYAAITAGAVRLVLQLTHAPLRRVSLSTALIAVGPRGAAFVASTLVVVALTFAGLLALVVPGIAVAVWHSLYAPGW